MNYLHLNLTRKWFDLIKSGEKTEEYRRVCPYWNKRFFYNYSENDWNGNGLVLINRRLYSAKTIILVFSNGYSTNRPSFMMFCEGLKIGSGRKEWGALPGIEYHTFLLGEICPF